MMRIAPTLAVAVALGIGHSAAQAATVSFDTLLGGDTLTAGDKTFSNFNVDFVDFFGSGFEPDPTQIDVETLDDGGMDPGPGLRFIFNDQMTVAGTGLLDYINYTISFQVIAADPFRIKDNSLALDATLANEFDNVGAYVLEKVFAPGADTANDTPIVEKDAELSFLAGSGVTEDLTDSAAFSPMLSILVTKNILVSALGDGEAVTVNTIEQRFSQTVPVPATALLLALGLTGVSVARRRSLGGR
jgi:hypothetical protein